MLIKGNIPQKEPIISIGLVLPEDKQQSILITDLSSKKTFIVKVNKNSILINDKKVQGEFILKGNKNQIFNLDRVSAGRGFHWAKKISLNISGHLLIRNIDGTLFIVIEIESPSKVSLTECSINCKLLFAIKLSSDSKTFLTKKGE